MAETITQAQSGAVPLTEDMYTKKGVDELIATVRKGGITPKGSSAFASLPTPAAENLGWMFNVTDAFTTTSAFVEGAGKSFPAGSNVYVCNPSGSTYKWDVLPGEGPQPGTSAPAADGTAAAGTSAKFAREDHVHPTDQTRAAAADLTSHTGNTTVHITAAERAAWNAKASTAVATATADGLMSKDDKSKLDGIAAGANVGFTGITGTSGNASADATHADVVITGTNITAAVSSNNAGALVSLAVADGSTSAKGVVQLSSATNSTSTTLAATASAVKAAYDRGSAGVTAAATAQTAAETAGANASAALTRLAAIESAAGTLLTNLSNAALADASMTNANTIKTAVLSLIDFLKAFAAASDNNDSTTHTVA